MAKWDFKIVGASFVKELVPIADDVQPRSQSFMQPSFHLEGGKIVMKESGQYVTAIYFPQIGEIGGVAPTDIDDAYAKLLTLVENFNGGEGTPQNLAQTLAIDNKTNDIPIVSNNGYSAINVNDDYLLLGYDNGDGSSNITFDGIQTSIQGLILASIYSGAVIQLGAETAIEIDAPAVDINTSILKYNTEEVATQPYADAKVADDLTASTTVAPSKTAVNTALDLKQDKGNYRKLVAVDAGNTTHTGTLTETIVSSILIPANSLDALCDLFFSYDYGKSAANALTIKVYLNTTNSLTGATLFASYGAGSNRNGGFFRKMMLRGTSLDTQASTATLLTNWPGDLLFAATNVITLNPAVNNYILVTITLSNTGDVFTTKRTILEKLNLVP